MKNEMIALAKYIESEARNNLEAHTNYHYQIKEAYSADNDNLYEFIQFHDMPDLQAKIQARESSLKVLSEHHSHRPALEAVIKRGKEILKGETISSIYRVDHAEFKLSDAVHTTSSYTVTCKPEVEACLELAKKIRKNAGKSFETPKRLGYTPCKAAGSLKVALRNFMADKDWAACANLALPKGVPLYVCDTTNGPYNLYEFVKDHPERNEYVIVKNHTNFVLLHRYLSCSLTSGESAEYVIKRMDDVMAEKNLTWSDVEDRVIKGNYKRHEILLEELCKKQGQPIDYQELWAGAQAGEVKVTLPDPKVVKAAKSTPAKPKAKALTKPVVNAALLMQALAALPKNYHA